jgi:tRNA A37 threonylcarbamoyladenosine synthetase subunit TsaC/SUA5/YrdC
LPSALRKLVHTRGALASTSMNTSGAPSRRSSERISAGAEADFVSAGALLGAGVASTTLAGFEEAQPITTATATAAEAVKPRHPALCLRLKTSPMTLASLSGPERASIPRRD